jgi:hypothetical protein
VLAHEVSMPVALEPLNGYDGCATCSMRSQRLAQSTRPWPTRSRTRMLEAERRSLETAAVAL